MIMKRSSSLMRSTISDLRFFPVSMALSFGFVLSYLFFMTEQFQLELTKEVGVERMIFSKETTGFGRKLLQSSSDDYDGIGSSTCSTEDISIYQGQSAPLPNGTPSYSVQILNECVSSSESCDIADIHVKCGWFSSIRLVDPQVFRRIDYDDCLVNSGQPLSPGQVLSFQYANTFCYPLSVSSVAC